MHRVVNRLVRATASAATLCILIEAAPSSAQTPAPAPAATPTMWNWLGLPKQPLSGIVNRNGNFPGSERKPRLKGIAAPENLASKNPAIKKAAEIKAEEDLAKQKIKAIKYLADVGCGGCYEGVAEALSAALDDCTEAVRYEAVKAIIKTSSCGQDRCSQQAQRSIKTCHEATHDAMVACMKNGCSAMHLLCGKPGPDGVTLKSKLHGGGCQSQGCPSCRCACGDGNCCKSEILNKLSTMAYEKDDRGCYKEPSPRVRAMAKQALRACRSQVRPYTGEEMGPVPEEVPVTPEVVPATTPEPKKETAPEQQKETAPALNDPTRQPETKADTSASDDLDASASPSAVALVEPHDVSATIEEAPLAVIGENERVGNHFSPEVVTTEAAEQVESVLVTVPVPVAPSPEDLIDPKPAKSPKHTHQHHRKTPAQARTSGQSAHNAGHAVTTTAGDRTRNLWNMQPSSWAYQSLFMKR